jgi:HK97 family phage major capsid protein
MLDAEVKAALDEIKSAWGEFTKANNLRLEEIRSKGSASGELVEKVEKLNGRIGELDEKIAKRADAIEKRIQTEGLFDGKSKEGTEQETKLVEAFGAELGKVITVEQYRAYRKIQAKVLRKGAERLNGDEQAALSVGDDTKGGYLVTPDVTGKIITKQFMTSPIRQVADVQTVTSDSYEGAVDRNEAGSGWVGETETRAETTTPDVQKYSVPVHEQYAAPRATQKVLDDAAVDIEAWLAGKVSDKLSRVENTAFVLGTGIKQPRGFEAYPTAATADDTRAWGTLEHILSGASGVLAPDPFLDLVERLKDKYLPNAKWLFHRLTLAKIRQLKDSQNRYLWDPGLNGVDPPTLLGYPYLRCEDMPVVAANALSVAFGDWKQGYQIVDRLGLRVLRDPYTAKPFVIFYTTKRVGGDVVDFEAIKFIKISP